jgi:hypothetical protein
MDRDARRCRAPHHEGLEDLILRSIAQRCVSKDRAAGLQIARANALAALSHILKTRYALPGRLPASSSTTGEPLRTGSFVSLSSALSDIL